MVEELYLSIAKPPKFHAEPYRLMLAVTYTDVARHSGTTYRAAGWQDWGESASAGRLTSDIQHIGFGLLVGPLQPWPQYCFHLTKPTSKPTSKIIGNYMGEPKCILIVDDEPGILGMVEALLTDEGYHTTKAGNGVEALKRLASRPHHLVLLDLMMPVMDGHTCCRIIKDKAETKNLPIILMSAMMDLKRKAADLCADGYLRKPFDIEELLELVAYHTR